jgi:hypothetical protein
VYTRPKVSTVRKRREEYSWSKAFWEVLKAGGEIPANCPRQKRNANGANNSSTYPSSRRLQYTDTVASTLPATNDDSKTKDKGPAPAVMFAQGIHAKPASNGDNRHSIDSEYLGQNDLGIENENEINQASSRIKNDDVPPSQVTTRPIWRESKVAMYARRQSKVAMYAKLDPKYLTQNDLGIQDDDDLLSQGSEREDGDDLLSQASGKHDVIEDIADGVEDFPDDENLESQQENDGDEGSVHLVTGISYKY